MQLRQQTICLNVMFHRLKVRSCFQSFGLKALGSKGSILLSERGFFLPIGRINQLLISLIDGCHTVDEIVELLSDKEHTAEVYYALELMERQGYIAESSEDKLPSNLTIFCEHLSVDPALAYRRLQATKVEIKTLGSHLPGMEFKTLLESMYIQVAEEGDIGDIEVVLTDDYLHEGLETFNEKALHRSRPWMLVKPLGTIVWLGPVFIPGKTGCWHCLAQRLQNNRPIERAIQNRGIAAPFPPLGYTSATCQTALGMAATEIFKWIVLGENKLLEETVVTYDTLSLKTQNHVLVKRPQCSKCGDGSKGECLPVVLEPRKKTFVTDGGHRCCSPEETLRRYQHHISPLTGIVRSLGQRLQDSQGLTHSYVAPHHFATVFDDLNALRQNLSGRSAGKGKTDVQAKVSGLCEAIERYSGVFQGDEIRIKGSYQQIGDRAIHPNTCMNFSPEQYQNRHEWNANCSAWFQRIPDIFDEEREIEWTPVWSLSKGEFKYLPTAYCYYGYPNSQKLDCWADSNGCAAGNTLEEAILQGFMELVERDCVALWWYNRLQKPRVDLDSFDDRYFSALKAHYQTLGRELCVLDITSDLNIPAFAAISWRSDREVKDIIFGFSAHFDAKLAIGRALSEVNQILPNVLSANADGTTRYPSPTDPLAIQWWQMATLENQPYLAGDGSLPPRVASDYPQLGSDDLLEDVATCQRLVEQKGMEMLVLDQTRSDIGLNVVKVIVPGMRHWWRRLGAGRLYEVPLKMGWLKEPLVESQVNPFPMWM